MAVRRRPLIGVTGPDHGVRLAWWFLRRAVRRAGGEPLHLDASSPEPDRPLDGIIIGGGTDIDPGLYAGFDDGKAKKDSRRDDYERAMIERALEAGIPLLGVCRGAQMLNVVLGGSLHQDVRPLRRRTSNRRTPLPRKTALVVPGSRLHAVLDCERCRINSLHHQAIDRLGDGLVVVARDLDDLVQAIEWAPDDAPAAPHSEPSVERLPPRTAFVVGVQWHPEYLVTSRSQRRLFAALVDAARGGHETLEGR